MQRQKSLISDIGWDSAVAQQIRSLMLQSREVIRYLQAYLLRLERHLSPEASKVVCRSQDSVKSSIRVQHLHNLFKRRSKYCVDWVG